MRHKCAGAILFASLVVLAGALTACGSDDGSTTATDSSSSAASEDTSSAAPSTSTGAGESSGTSSPSTSATSQAALPSCGSVWKDGQKLPGSYAGCQQGSSSVDAAELSCSSGQSLVRFAPHYWAVAGGVIHRSANINKDDDYLASISRCRG